MTSYYQLVDANKARSGLVIAVFIAFITLATYLICYTLGFDLSAVGIALIVSGAISIGAFYYSDQMILGLSGAVAANKRDHFDLYTVAENISRSAGIPMPKLFVINDSSMNTFATGRDPEHAVVCITTGLLSKLNRTELEGVVAHEMSHIRNFDTRLMSIVAILVGLVTLLADILLRTRIRGKSDRDDGNLGAILMIAGLVLALLSPLIAQLIQLAISRRREFLADATGASITKYPEGLASALEKLSKDKEPLEAANKATAHLFIVNPLKNLPAGRKATGGIGWFAGLFNTHPPIAERIKALRS
jgi:heat shock protein HtpX